MLVRTAVLTVAMLGCVWIELAHAQAGFGDFEGAGVERPIPTVPAVPAAPAVTSVPAVPSAPPTSALLRPPSTIAELISNRSLIGERENTPLCVYFSPDRQLLMSMIMQGSELSATGTWSNTNREVCMNLAGQVHCSSEYFSVELARDAIFGFSGWRPAGRRGIALNADHHVYEIFLDGNICQSYLARFR
ncbi:MAG: hypothetical protein H6843_04350 [Rhodospirillaceae bacterium]|nr:hypothetical protein [Rhodospirillaceae bacterium]